MSIFTKPILTSPKGLQRLRLRPQTYPLKVVYKPGPQIFISDTLSRAALPLRQIQADTPDYLIFQVQEEERFRQEFEETNLEEAVFVTDQRLEQIRQETNKDASLQTLMTLISVGLPNDKLQTPLCVREYWPYRNELSTQKWPSLSRNKNHYSPLNENRDDSSSPSLPPWNPVHDKHCKRHHVYIGQE